MTIETSCKRKRKGLLGTDCTDTKVGNWLQRGKGWGWASCEMAGNEVTRRTWDQRVSAPPTVPGGMLCVGDCDMKVCK